jgi:hypothetical protein
MAGQRQKLSDGGLKTVQHVTEVALQRMVELSRFAADGLE